MGILKVSHNYKFRGGRTQGQHAELRKARELLKRAQKGVKQKDGTYKQYGSILDRYENDYNFSYCLHRDYEKMDREKVTNWDHLAELPRTLMPMDQEARRAKFGGRTLIITQDKAGGARTIPTKDHPEYEMIWRSKSAVIYHNDPPEQTTSTSSSSQQWSRSSWQTGTITKSWFSPKYRGPPPKQSSEK